MVSHDAKERGDGGGGGGVSSQQYPHISAGRATFVCSLVIQHAEIDIVNSPVWAELDLKRPKIRMKMGAIWNNKLAT